MNINTNGIKYVMLQFIKNVNPNNVKIKNKNLSMLESFLKKYPQQKADVVI